MKKIMMLGGNAFQASVIIRAKELGYHVISVDYLPDNPGHRFSDEYYNISTVDKEAVLALARSLGIDGILSYASDVSAPTAAYVAEAMGLPTNPYEAVMTLTHKDRFRAFMEENGFPTPQGRSFTEAGPARAFFESLPLPVMVKPVDASGSKGVVKVTERAGFDAAFAEAMGYSLGRRVIVEQFIPRTGWQIDGDGFISDGQIVFFGVMDQHQNPLRNPYAPIGLSCPSAQDPACQARARELIQAIFDKLGMRFGAFNFEYIISPDGQIYLLEIGPRNGGNYIPETIRYATGVDMLEASVRACAGDEYMPALVQSRQLAASSYVVHAMRSGRFRGLEIAPEMDGRIVKSMLSVQPGDPVRAFRHGGDALGAMVLRFDSYPQMQQMMERMWEYIRVVVDKEET